MKISRSVLRRTGAFLLFSLAAAGSAQAQVSLTTLGTPYTQNFDSLPASGSATWTNNSTIPGWFHARTGTGTTIVANDGASNAGNLYSYGAAAATDRALGSLGSGNAAIGNLFYGVRLQNNTGATITTLDVTYTGEQWRNSAAAAQTAAFSYLVGTPTVTGSLAEFQSAGVAVTSLDFTSPITGGTAGALVGNNAPNRTTITFSITGLSIPNGTEIMLRWSDPDHTGADHGLSIDDFSVTPQGGLPTPNLSINDVALAEGDAGTTTFTFTVSLSAPAGPGGVTFDIATADGTATDDNPIIEDNDYVANSLTGQTIPAGSSTYAFNVLVNGDVTAEPNETFFVNATNITGANVADAQGQGTINNDDVSITPIHDIQGPGASSPIVGASVSTRGIVTGVRTNGFFIQELDAQVDADPATSEAILVFTSSAPPAAVVLGALLQVTGTVTEFVPSQDPFQPPLTELTTPTVLQLSTGNPLPAAIPLTATFPDPAGPHDQLERLEGMRVSVASLTVGAPTGGTLTESAATSASTGVFQGTITGVPRAFREPGIQAPDPAPPGFGTIPPIPRFDSNPEVIRVDSDGIVGQPALNVGSGAVVTGLVGPLDYTFRRYTVLPDGTTGTPAVAGGPTPTPATAPLPTEITIASYNLQRFYDTVDDAGVSDVALTPTAFDNRLAKASLGIRDFLNTPDILGVVEVENLATLQSLAARISADAIAASQPDPQYLAFLVEGNDVGGIDVGVLVKSAQVAPATARVSVTSVTQFNAAETYINPATGAADTLNDRPPLVLEAVVNSVGRPPYPVTVIVNHLRSLNNVNDETPDGASTVGNRIRVKRQAQAASLANLVQGRQTANPSERIVLVGDFNAFQFNDGLGDSMNTIAGTPSPDNETAVPGDGADLVNPDLDNVGDSLPVADRYSYIFDGNAQTIDHVLVNEDVITSTAAIRTEHPRINADFADVNRNNAASPSRLSDHDPVLLYLGLAAAADVSITKTDTPDPVIAGSNLTYTITVTNNGPDAATNVSFSDTLPPGTTFNALPAQPGWSCTTPAIGAGGTVTCTHASLPVGSTVFTLTVTVDAAVAAGTVLNNTATVTTTTADPNAGNDSATATTTVTTSADLSVTKTDAPDPVAPATNLTYTIVVTNAGPSNAATVALNDTLPAGTTFVSLTSPGGWSCTTPAVGAGGTVACTIASLAAGNASFTLVVAIDAGVAPATVLSNTATVTSVTTDPNIGNESATATTTVGTGSADLSVTKTDTPDPVTAGSTITYTITASNTGPANATDATVSDTLPAGTTFVSLASPAGWSCSTPAVGAGGAVSCANTSFSAGNAVFTLVVAVDAGTAGGTVLSNTATVTSSTTDPVAGNNSATATTTVTALAGDVSVTVTDAPDPVTAGANITYTITANNAGPGAASTFALSDTLPAGTTFVSLTAPAGFTCTTPAVGAAGTVSCTNASMPVGSAVFTLVVQVAGSVTASTVISNTATVSTTSSDPNAGNNTATTTTTVAAAPAATVSGTKTSAGTRQPGSALTYTIVLSNTGSGAQGDNAGNEFTDVLPASVTLVSASASSGTAVATVGTNTVTWNGTIPAGGSVTITINATIRSDVVAGTVITNQGTISYDADANGSNETTVSTDDPGTAAPVDGTAFPVVAGGIIAAPVPVPTMSSLMTLLLAGMLGLFALAALRRRVH